MITITESSNWIAQHHSLLGLLCSGIAVLSATAFITLFFTRLTEQRLKYHNLALGASLAVLITSGCLIVVIAMQGPHYSGSAEYTVKQSEIQTSGQQVITINDGKSDVKLNVDDDDKATYKKGDKVDVNVQSDDKSNHGKHYLSNVLRGQSNKNILFKTEYTLKKSNVDLHKAINELFD